MDIIWKIISPLIGALISKHQEQIKADFAKELIEMKNKFAIEFQGKKEEYKRELEKYKSYTELKRNIIMEIYLKKINSYQSIIEVLYRTSRIMHGGKLTNQYEDLRKIEESTFYDSEIVSEKIRSIGKLIKKMLEMEERNETFSDDFKNNYYKQIKELRIEMYNDIRSDDEMTILI